MTSETPKVPANRTIRARSSISRHLSNALALALCALVHTACVIPGPSTSDTELAAIPRETVRAGSRELSILRAGDPELPRVVFLHGTPGAADGWADYLVVPPEGFEAVAVDRPGFGETLPRKAVPSLTSQAEALEPLWVERGGVGTFLVGHSLGAPIAAQAAVLFPERVAGLVILAGSLDPDLERVLWIQYVGRWFALEWLIPRWARHANRELIDLETHLRALQPRLGDVQCPIVIVHGTEDGLVPYANVAYMETHFAANPRVEVVRLEGQNHFLPWNSEAEVRRAIARVAAW